jgi:23S rRNA (cytidine1920-2'-O)/16S rRNA (cytidine1409-2'-O)-methyltransferase
LFEQTDIRNLYPDLLAEPPDFLTIDVSFISLKLVLPLALALARAPARLIALIKPQFEAGHAQVKKGIVRDSQTHAAVCEGIAAFVTSLRWSVAGVIPSPILGGDGNREFLIGARRD